jgi:hypothetical protein
LRLLSSAAEVSFRLNRCWKKKGTAIFRRCPVVEALRQLYGEVVKVPETKDAGRLVMSANRFSARIATRLRVK